MTSWSQGQQLYRCVRATLHMFNITKEKKSYSFSF
jgi:hypothetical protein